MNFPTTIATAAIGRCIIEFQQTAPDVFAVTSTERHEGLDADDALIAYSNACERAVRANLDTVAP